MTEEQAKYEVAARSETADNSPAALIIKAMAGGMDLDKLEKFMALQEKWEANQARKAYVEAMAAFKADPPEIEKDRHVEFKTSTGKTEYNHATLGNVTEKINSALSAHGLSAAWETSQNEKGVTVTCKITHILGHSESTSLTAVNDQSGGKNAIQALGSTISYLQRYTILALTGLATHEMDTDGRGEVEYIDNKQLSTLMDMIDSKGIDKEKFLTFMGVDSFEKIPVPEIGKAMQAAKLAKGKAA